MIKCDDPDITVVVTVYQRLSILRDALDSVRLQSFEGRRVEVIVADDGASPDVRRILRIWVRTISHYRPNGTRLGVALSVREALRSARGRYVAIINDDDLWEQDFLRELIAPLEADPGCVLAFCDHWIIDENGTIDLQSSEALSRRFRRAQRPAARLPRLHVQLCWTE